MCMYIHMDINIDKHRYRYRLQRVGHGCRMIYAGIPSFFGLGLEAGHVPTIWLLL